MSNDQSNKPDDETDFESLLDDLYSLQESLIKNRPNKEIVLPDTDQSADLDSLDIPILTEALDQEINRQKRPTVQTTEVQQHLFGEPPAEEIANHIDEKQIDAIVDKVVARHLPSLEEKLRQRVRAKVIDRLQEPR